MGVCNIAMYFAVYEKKINKKRVLLFFSYVCLQVIDVFQWVDRIFLTKFSTTRSALYHLLPLHHIPQNISKSSPSLFVCHY